MKIYIDKHYSLLYESKCWAFRKDHIMKRSVEEMRMLAWSCDNTLRVKIWYVDIWKKVGVATGENKMTEN